MEIRIGTQSWTYPQWNGVFYDSQTPPQRQLAAYAEQFDFVEVDATFYGTPPAHTMARWFGETPAAFLFALKMPRDITHEHVFVDCDISADIFFSRALELHYKLGPILVQLPPSLDAGAFTRVVAVLKRRPAEIRCAVEARHESWFRPAIFDGFAEIGVAMASVDSPFTPQAYAHRTLARNMTDFSYVRLLGTRDMTLPFNRKFVERDEELRSWAERIQGKPVAHTYVTVSNFYEGFSPGTAMTIAEMLGISLSERRKIEQASLF